MRYSTFLLDLDHTLFDSDASESAAFAQTMAAAGVGNPARYAASYQSINLELWARVERGEISPQHVRTRRFERLAAEEDIDADPLQMAEDFVSGLGANGDLYDGAREMLEQLSDQATLALITNGLGEVQRTRIERLGIDEYFDAVVISAEVGAAKPGTKIFDIAFEALDFPSRKRSLMVGDNLASDIQGGANYGIATCWYNPNGDSVRDADHVVHEINDLAELLGLVAV
ncbi:MAG: YjjG family noncanonical pyrimidine nucleotidase [Gammaproteobacteria bacterium]|nr:YjjG family noncanonical pyrimidine nucleotidase [Gammaproteobacteria bacterium]MDH3414854.1 YjjG family noncanonical pyrimidine nucleotidase [Gammaproteobacteria bacterium]